MEDFKVRMLDEAEALWAKIIDLEKFVTTSDVFTNLSWKVRMATRFQLFMMRRYYFWLSHRISLLCTPEDITEYTTPVAVEEPVIEIAAEAPKKTNKPKKKTKKKVSNE
jgi:hypothetical protein